MARRLREEKAWLVHRHQVLQGFQIRAICQPGHANDFGIRQLQFAKQQVVAGIVHQHGGTWWHKVADHQVHRTVGPLCQQNLTGLCTDAK